MQYSFIKSHSMHCILFNSDFVKATIIFVLTMSILLLIFVPKIIFLRKEKADIAANRNSSITSYTSNASSTNLSSLRVMGTRQYVRRISAPVESTINRDTSGGVTRKQMEDLRKILQKVGPIDNLVDLQALIESAGIVVSSDDRFPISQEFQDLTMDVIVEEQESESSSSKDITFVSERHVQ